MLDDTNRSVVSATANMADDAFSIDDTIDMPADIASIMVGRIRFRDLCYRLSNGEWLKTIAADAGVTPGAISHRIERHPKLRETYMLARQAGATVRVEGAASSIGDAGDMVSITRAREEFRAVSWMAEREHPERFGRREQVTVTTDLGSALSTIYARRVGEGRSAGAITRTGNMLNRAALAHDPIDASVERVDDARHGAQADRRSLVSDGETNDGGSMAGPGQ